MTMTMTVQQGASANRRDQMRRMVIKGAKIIFNNRKSVLDCRVRDLTADGARLDLSTQQLLPHEFELQVAGDPTRRCGLRWARGTQAGVRFLG
ncbi:PilZ domain-containing protein [Dongia deserti]|uniref:PilZ domain-containing protein n=1 Tax=Dongia deserti TaxID=2268030 RepID=UPI000E65269B|nr:PilZ domain-containing protein [Dongia deserti]